MSVFQAGKDDVQLMPRHKKRARLTAASSENAVTAAGHFSLNGDQSCETTSGILLLSSGANEGSKTVENCLEASALATGHAIVSVNPLSVETQFMESPAGPNSSGSTTDTASEVASLIHSPGESSSVSTVDSSFDGRVTKGASDDLTDDRSQLDDSRSDLDNRLAAAAHVLACEDARSSVLNVVDNEHPASVKTEDGSALPGADGEAAEKVNGQKCPPRFSTKVGTVIMLIRFFSYHFIQYI